jgi:hypothetical protein
MVTFVNKGKYWYGYARVALSNFSQEATAATDFEYTIIAVPWKCRVKKCSVIFDAGITGDNTNYSTIAVKNRLGDGSGTATIASKAFTLGVDATAYRELDLGAVANNQLFPGDVLTFKKTHTSAGVILQAGVVKVELVRIQ